MSVVVCSRRVMRRAVLRGSVVLRFNIRGVRMSPRTDSVVSFLRAIGSSGRRAARERGCDRRTIVNDLADRGCAQLEAHGVLIDVDLVRGAS